VKIWDVLSGRSKPPKNNLDSLFGIPGAAVTLQTSMGFRATGVGSVCFRAAEGAAFAQTQSEVVELLDSDEYGAPVEQTTDQFGFTWLVSRQDAAGIDVLVTDLHAVNTTLEAQGFGPSLLCSVVVFEDLLKRRLGLVYLYKQGKFYPFVPTGPNSRDNILEIQVRDLLANELPLEPQLNRWMAVWGAPGL
jgi:hypothetical protein